MPKKKIKKIRGSRYCGQGVKGGRGGGSRGGRGNAGVCKHHYIKALLEGREMGKRGFTPPYRSEKSTMNVGELDELAERLIAEGKAERRGDAVFIDLTRLGVDKLLGGGSVRRKLIVSVPEASERARAKIERVGGELVIGGAA
ncbi:MAG: Ribosomal protein L15 [Candidatus Alkanophagales archaeon MCA70_species_1]|nr:Ribosomal protein L15 [Candidatus Alkanophaga volatiphilum]